MLGLQLVDYCWDAKIVYTLLCVCGFCFTIFKSKELMFVRQNLENSISLCIIVRKKMFWGAMFLGHFQRTLHEARCGLRDKVISAADF